MIEDIFRVGMFIILVVLVCVVIVWNLTRFLSWIMEQLV